MTDGNENEFMLIDDYDNYDDWWNDIFLSFMPGIWTHSKSVAVTLTTPLKYKDDDSE